MRTAPVEAGKVRLKGLKINFLSPVTRPAHEGAVALLLKRRDYVKAAHEEDDEDESGFSLARRKKRKKDLAAAARRRKRNPCTMKIQAIAEAWATAMGKEWAESDHDELADFIGSFEDSGIDKIVGHGARARVHRSIKFEDANEPVVMTSSIDGHAHLLHLSGRAGTSTWQKSEGEENGHDHPFMVTLSDAGIFSVEIGDAEGHTHTIDNAALNAAFAAAALSKLHQEDDMTKTTKSAEEVQALETNLELARLFGGFSEMERAHFVDLAETEKVAFAKLDATARQATITASEAGNAIVYTDSKGQVYKAGDDVRLVELAKSADEDRKAAQKLAEGFAQSSLEKRAEDELKGYPGTPAQKAAMLSALEGISDPALRKAALAAMTAGGTAIGKAFDTLGTAEAREELGLEAEPNADDPDAQIEAMAQAAMAKDPTLGLGKAYDQVLLSPEGRKLYAKVQKGTIDATPPH